MESIIDIMGTDYNLPPRPAWRINTMMDFGFDLDLCCERPYIKINGTELDILTYTDFPCEARVTHYYGAT